MKNNKGQVALIVLLLSAVAMTIGLGMSRKTVVDTKVETDEESLKQAFNTAESGVEYYLGTGGTHFTAIDNLSIADIVVGNIGEGSTINLNQYTLNNSNLAYWLVGHDANGDIDEAVVYGGDSLSVCMENSFDRAIKVDYFYSNALGNYQVQRFGYNLTLDLVNGFTNVTPVQGNCISGYREQSLGVTLGAGITPTLLVVKPIGGGGRFYLLGNNGTFPIQGISISATGIVGDVETGVKRKINVIQTYQVPSFALEAITAFGDVLSN
jgi:hypothetical protein